MHPVALRVNLSRCFRDEDTIRFNRGVVMCEELLKIPRPRLLPVSLQPFRETKSGGSSRDARTNFARIYYHEGHAGHFSSDIPITRHRSSSYHSCYISFIYINALLLTSNRKLYLCYLYFLCDSLTSRVELCFRHSLSFSCTYFY